MVGQDGDAEGDVDVFGVSLSMAKKTPDKRRNKLRYKCVAATAQRIRNVGMAAS